MARWTAALLAPGAVTTLMSSSLPVSWAMACAVGSVNAARVAPARLFAVPNWAMPVMVKDRGGSPAEMTRTRWPTAKWYFCAVPASITTSSGATGGPPAIRCSGGHLLVRVVGHADGGRAAAGRDGLAVPRHELGVAG